jgi:hypothetical protein
VQFAPVSHEVPLMALEQWANGPSISPREGMLKRPLCTSCASVCRLCPCRACASSQYRRDGERQRLPRGQCATHPPAPPRDYLQTDDLLFRRVFSTAATAPLPNSSIVPGSGTGAAVDPNS